MRRLALWLVGALAVIAAAALLAACGSSSSTSSSSSPSATATTGATWTSADLAAIKADPSLKAMLPAGMTSVKVASDIPYAPWEYYVNTTSKQLTGFDYELSQAIGAEIGVPVSFSEQAFDSMPLAIKAGKFDVAMSDMYDRADREKILNFVDYAYDTTGILVAKGNPDNITNLDSLAGKNVAVESGTSQQFLLQSLNTQFKSSGKTAMNILTLPDEPSALLAIESGKAACVLTDHSVALYTARTAKNGTAFQLAADPAAPKGYLPTLVGAGIAKSNTALLTVWQKALQDLIDSGAYGKLIAAYGLTPVTSAQINQGPKQSSASPSP
jgi:polar amino acid transport system substrate-binding protein